MIKRVHSLRHGDVIPQKNGTELEVLHVADTGDGFTSEIVCWVWNDKGYVEPEEYTFHRSTNSMVEVTHNNYTEESYV